jgi:hypothetical protein
MAARDVLARVQANLSAELIKVFQLARDPLARSLRAKARASAMIADRSYRPSQMRGRSFTALNASQILATAIEWATTGFTAERGALS